MTQDIACVKCDKVLPTIYYYNGSSYCIRCFNIVKLSK